MTALTATRRALAIAWSVTLGLAAMGAPGTAPAAGEGAGPGATGELAPPVLDLAGAPFRGARDAPLVIVEYSDYQ
jgi:hypothetical protein